MRSTVCMCVWNCQTQLSRDLDLIPIHVFFFFLIFFFYFAKMCRRCALLHSCAVRLMWILPPQTHATHNHRDENAKFNFSKLQTKRKFRYIVCSFLTIDNETHRTQNKRRKLFTTFLLMGRSVERHCIRRERDALYSSRVRALAMNSISGSLCCRMWKK